MDLSNNHSEPRSSHTPTASSDEVRDFLQTIKCKDPEKVLGVEATRNLGTALVVSTVVTVAAMVLFTIGPYYSWGRVSAATKPEAKPVEKETRSETPEPTKATPAVVEAPTKTAPDKGKADKSKTDKGFLEKIGATDTKPANPKVNPLEKTTDDLFKDIDKK